MINFAALVLSDRTYKYVVIALTAGSLLMWEILLTRICAMRLFFHFAFLVISNCLLGIAASGSLITLYQEEWKRNERRILQLCSGAYLVSLVAAYVFLLNFPLPDTPDLGNPRDFLVFTLFNAAGAVPFFTGGLVIGMIISFNAAQVNRLYGADLVAAALGCISLPFLMAGFGAGGVFIVICALALLASLAALPPAQRKLSIALGAAGVVLGAWQLPGFDARYRIPIKMFDLTEDLRVYAQIPDFSAWSTNSRIDLMPERFTKPFIFTRGSRTKGLPPIPEQRLILQDSSAGTFIVNFTDSPEALEILERSTYSAALRLKESPRVFIIGAGGGNDVWAAQRAGAAHVKAVELNAPILTIHREVLPHYTRAIFTDPRIEWVLGEGRSALERDGELYDVVQMTGIDTWTALTSGAYVLAENYLYTREALVTMLNHLADGGIVQISRMAASMEALRMVSNFHAAFQELGRDDLDKSMIALTTSDFTMSFLVKNGAFSSEEIASTKRFAKQSGIRIVYLPGHQTGTPVARFLRSKQKQTFIEDFPRDISATSDDRPYFFNFTRWDRPFRSGLFIDETASVSQGNPLFILMQLATSLVLSSLLILLPAYRLRGFPGAGAGAGHYLLYFAGLGLGFILFEIAAIQKLTLFLGHPTYSITVTLFSLLLFTGIGSLVFAYRLAVDDARCWIVPIAIAVGIATLVFTSPWLVSSLIGLALPLRVAITVLLLAPMGLLLGIPFAYGIRILDARSPGLIPWAWAINGCFSVIGSILTVVISMNLGFNVVLALSGTIYLGAFWAIRAEVTRSASA